MAANFNLSFQWEAMNEGIVTSCHFSYDGRYLVNSSDLDFAVNVWDVREGSLIKKLFSEYAW